MQDDFSRPLQESYTLAKFGQDSILKRVMAEVEDAMILNPKMPAVQLADLIIGSADAALTSELHLYLERQFYRRAIRSRRAKQAAASHAQLLLPGFEHLPLNIPGPKGVPIRLLDANTRAVREYCRFLMKHHREQRRNDPRVKEAFALLAKMQAASRNEKRITVREVMLMEEQ